MFQFLKVVPLALMMLSFCFFISALANDEGQKSRSQLSSGSKESRVVQLKKGAAVVGPNIQVHPSSTTVQTEVPIITHPLNPNVVLGSSNANPLSRAFMSQGWYYTTDGGANWLGGDTLPTHTVLSKGMADPSVIIDLDGNLFISALLFPKSTPSVRDLIVARSTNNGSTWTQITVPNTGREDKDHITADVNPGSPFENYIYLAHTELTLQPWPIMFSRSADGGANFSTPVSISGSVTGAIGANGVNLAVGPNGEVYATWTSFEAFPPQEGDTFQFGFNKSTNGGANWQVAQSILKFATLPQTIQKGPNCIRVISLPSMAVDRSNSPRRGWIYIVYPALTPTGPDIFLIRSTDAGGSWSAPSKVNQDTTTKDQWWNWVSVDPATGNLYAVYYDSRNFPNNDSAQIYISSSTDGGQSFEDVLVSDVPFLPTPDTFAAGVGTNYWCYMGDYIGIAALNGVVWPYWNDDRSGIDQAYTSKVVFDSITIPPTINVRPDTLDFGEVILGIRETLTVKVRNLGYPDTLEVSNISSDNSAFKPLDTTFSVPGASSQSVKVEITPSLTLKDDSTGTLTIANNDTSNANLAVPFLATLVCLWKPGDFNGDGTVNLTDIIGLVNHVFKGAPAPIPSCRGNANGISPINLTDIIYLVNRVFKFGPLPVKTNVCCL